VHGANFGIRADTYLALGGWRGDLSCNEDIDLARRADAATGVRILRTAALPVLTSARLTGRAPDGFSSYLRHLRPDGRDRPRAPRGLGMAAAGHHRDMSMDTDRVIRLISPGEQP
jgi:hypothetical protein